MGDLVLHPTHPFFKTHKQPMCDTCNKPIYPMTPIEIVGVEGQPGWYVVHAECVLIIEPINGAS